MDRLRPDNPFAPPVTDDPAPSVGSAGGAVSYVPRVFGVLSIVFAALTLGVMLVAVLGVAFFAHPHKRAAPAVAPPRAAPVPARSINPPVERSADRAVESPRASGPTAVRPRTGASGSWAFKALAAVVGLLVLLLVPALLVIGIGQVRYRRWACRATIGWSVVALAWLACLVAMAWLDPEEGQRPAAAAVAAILFFGPYPTLQLVFFSRSRTVAAMQR